MWTIDLQVRRLATVEPEDDRFPGRWWVDLQFLVSTFRRLRRAAELTRRASDTAELREALSAFDGALPNLKKMRDVNEHFDSYILDSPSRHDKTVDRTQLQTGSWDGRTYSWLSDADGGMLTLDVVQGKNAAYDLYLAITAAASS